MKFLASPTEVLSGWWERLNTPIGWFLLIVVAVYIILRVTGRIDGVFEIFGRKGGNSGSGGGSSQKPDYILK